MSVISEALRQAERENRHRGSINPPRGDRPSHGNIADLATEPAAQPAIAPEADEKPVPTGGRASNSRIVIVCAAAGLLILLPTTVGRVFREPWVPRPFQGRGTDGADAADRHANQPSALRKGGAPAAVESNAQPVFEMRPLVPETTPSTAADADEAQTAMLAPKYSLKGMMFGDGEAVAIVNGVAVCVGDRIDQAEVIGIGTGQVRLREHNVVFSIRLGAEDRLQRR